MKSVKNLLLTTLCVLTFGALNVDAYTVNESVNPEDNLTVIEDGSIIIGITRFDASQVLTSGRVNIASNNYTLYAIEHRFDKCYELEDELGDYTPEVDACYEANKTVKPAPIYYYLVDSWFEINEANKATTVTDEATIEALNNQAIYYVNNEMKTLKIKLDIDMEVKEGYSVSFYSDDNYQFRDLSSLFKYENGYLEVPVLAEEFYIEVYDKDGNWIEDLAYYQVDLEKGELVENFVLEGTITDTPEKDGTVEGDTITFGGVIPWYDGSVEGRKLGNRVGVTIEAGSYFEEGYELEDIEVTVNGFGYENKTFTWSEDTHGTDTTFVWYPLVTASGETGTMTVEWGESYTQVFTIKIADDATLEAAPAGTIEWDNETGRVEGKEFYLNEEESTIIAGGEGSVLAWYGEGVVSYGLKSGNRIGVTIKAPKHYIDNNLLANAKLVITDEETPNGVTIPMNSNGIFNYYPLFTQTGKATVKAIWEDGNEQVFTIELLEGTTLESAKYLGTIEQQETDETTMYVNGNQVVVNSEIPFYEADANANGGNREAGHRVGVKIAPNKYYLDKDADENDTFKLADVKVVITAADKEAKEYKWSDDTAGEATTFDYWPLMSESYEGDTTVTVTWEEGVTQTFTIKLGVDASFENIYGTIAVHNDDNKYAPEATVDGDTVKITGEAKYYSQNDSIGRDKAGHRVGLKITASEYFQEKLGDKLDEVQVVIDGKTYNWKQGAADETTGKEVNFYYWPLVGKDEVAAHTIKVMWADDYTQTFTVDLTETTYENVYGTIAVHNDDNKYTPEATVENDTVKVTGEVKFYSKDTTIGRNATGYRVGVKITASEYFQEKLGANLDNVKVYVEGVEDPYTWKQGAADEATGNEVNFYYWPLVTETDTTREVRVVWEDNFEQTFTIDLTNATYEQVLGTIKANSDDNNYMPEVSYNGNDVTFSGNIAYYEVNEQRPNAGNRVGVIITPSEHYKGSLDKVEVDIDGTSYNWVDGAYDAEDITFNYWPLMSSSKKSTTVTVTWEEGVTQTFNIKIADDAVLFVSTEGAELLPSFTETITVTEDVEQPETITPNASSTLKMTATHDNLRFRLDNVKTPEGAIVKVWAQDETGVYDMIENGWGPVEGFTAATGAEATCNLQVAANTAGTYSADLVLYNVVTGQVIEQTTVTFTVAAN